MIINPSSTTKLVIKYNLIEGFIHMFTYFQNLKTLNPKPQILFVMASI